MQKPQSSIVMLVIIVAIILAAASSLFLFALQGRPDAPVEEQGAEGEQSSELQVINVEGVDITVRRTVDNALFMQPGAVQIESAPAQQPEQAPPVETQTQEQPTAQPPALEQPTAVPVAPAQDQQPLPTAVPPNRANTAVDPIIYQAYTVQASDSLYNITRQLNTSITLMAVKGIAQDHLVAGTVIQVPVGNPAYCPGMTPYAVGEGDTAFSIAQRRNTTPENLQAINSLDANFTIFSGTIICVP